MCGRHGYVTEGGAKDGHGAGQLDDETTGWRDFGKVFANCFDHTTTYFRNLINQFQLELFRRALQVKSVSDCLYDITTQVNFKKYHNSQSFPLFDYYYIKMSTYLTPISRR